MDARVMGYKLLDDSPRPKGTFRLLEDAPDATGTFTENLAAGAGKAIYDLGRGAKQILDVPAQYLENKFGGQTLSALLGMPTAKESAAQTEAEVADSRVRDKPLMDTGGGMTGNIAGNVVASLALPGAGTYAGAAGAGAALAGLQPTLEGESRLLNTGIGAAGGSAAKFAGDKIAWALANRLTSAEANAVLANTQNAPRAAALAAGKEAGYVVPPTQANPSLVNRALEGFSGKIQTGQVASVKNQAVTNQLARKALGITDDTPITPDVLTSIRAKAGEAYQALRGAGTIRADKQFVADLARITQKYEGAAKDFPELAKNEIAAVVQSVNKQSFAADSAIDAIGILRDKAAAAFAKGDKSVGSAYRATSNALEDAIERNLLEAGDQTLLKGFQTARKLIAKTYSVEKALNTSGNVNAQNLAVQLGKGKPLTDELRTIAEFAGSFKKAAQNIDQIGSTPGVSPLDAAVAVLTGGAPGAAWFLGRPAVRSLILSKPYQAAMTIPEQSASGALRLGARAANSDTLQKLLPGLGATAALGYGK